MPFYNSTIKNILKKWHIKIPYAILVNSQRRCHLCQLPFLARLSGWDHTWTWTHLTQTPDQMSNTGLFSWEMHKMKNVSLAKTNNNKSNGYSYECNTELLSNNSTSSNLVWENHIKKFSIELFITVKNRKQLKC